MLIKEFRVVMPLSVEEYEIAQLYTTAEMSMLESGGKEGVEIVKNEPFDNYPLFGGQYTQGQYTYKKYHLARKLPTYVRMLSLKGTVEIHEESWNAYPYCRTVIRNPGYMKENFVIVIESLHLPDKGDQDNVHELPQEKLRLREVVTIDIANDPVIPSEYKRAEDPSLFKSLKAERGPLKGMWIDSAEPVMTCYKLVTAEFIWFGLQTRVENFILNAEKRLFTNFHRKVYCWIDHWYGKTMDDVRALEDKIKEDLVLQRRTGEVRGMIAESN